MHINHARSVINWIFSGFLKKADNKTNKKKSSNVAEMELSALL